MFAKARCGSCAVQQRDGLTARGVLYGPQNWAAPALCVLRPRIWATPYDSVNISLHRQILHICLPGCTLLIHGAKAS